MRKAKEFASDTVSVELYATVFEEDTHCVPAGFTRTENLKRSILDVKPFTTQKKLPLIYDILDNVYQATNADYIMYTNIDIIPMPQLYLLVNSYIQDGFDSIIINRRNIEKTKDNSLNTLSKIWSAIGNEDYGYDCFTFPRKHYQSYVTDECCLGVASVDTGLASNLMAFAEKFILKFTNEEFTSQKFTRC